MLKKKKILVVRRKELLILIENGKLPKLVSCDEKPVLIQHIMNKYNDRFYLPERASETQTPAIKMVRAVRTLLSARIYRLLCQYKCQMLSALYFKRSSKALGSQTFQLQTMEIKS